MTHFGVRVASFLISGDGALLFHFSLSKIVGLHSSRKETYARRNVGRTKQLVIEAGP